MKDMTQVTKQLLKRHCSNPNGFEKTEAGGQKKLKNIAPNVWCYEQVCLAEMFNFSTNVIGKLAYSTCYTLAR